KHMRSICLTKQHGGQNPKLVETKSDFNESCCVNRLSEIVISEHFRADDGEPGRAANGNVPGGCSETVTRSHTRQVAGVEGAASVGQLIERAVQAAACPRLTLVNPCVRVLIDLKARHPPNEHDREKGKY